MSDEKKAFSIEIEEGNFSKAIELFEVISANFESYENKLDEIIIMYYKFILEVYNNVRDYFKQEAKEVGD